MYDVTIILIVATRNSKELNPEEQIKNISYIINEGCHKLENINCDVFYKMFVDGKRYLELKNASI